MTRSNSDDPALEELRGKPDAPRVPRLERRERTLLIVNKKSRSGDAGSGELEALLARHGMNVREVDCDRRAAVSEAIRRNAGTVDRVVVGGGDGTLNAAAPALIETGLPLGILPLGTANDLARTLGIPNDVNAACEIISAGLTRTIDVGEANGVPFFNVASLGLSVEIAQTLSRDVKRRFGTFAYVVAACRALLCSHPIKAEICIDGECRQSRTMQIAVGNGRYYGGGLTISEDARIDDGNLDVYSIETNRLWTLALMYPAFRKGRQAVWNEVRTASCAHVDIHTRKPKAVNTDGEILTKTPVHFRVRKEAVTVFVPANTGDPAL